MTGLPRLATATRGQFVLRLILIDLISCSWRLNDANLRENTLPLQTSLTCMNRIEWPCMRVKIREF